MKRDYDKLVADYEKKFFGAPANAQLGQFYVSDFNSILATVNDISNEMDKLFEAISTALKAGVMIGYNARKTEEKIKSKKIARRINVSEIQKLKRGSVIWHEIHSHDDEYNIDYHSIIPMMVGASGKNGVLCWGDQNSELYYDIGNGLDNMIFWDKEPNESQIDFGLSEEEYNSL